MAADGGGARAIAGQAGRYGHPLSDQAPVTAGQIAPGTVRVVVTRMTASVPNCPDYSRLPPDFEASTSSNYGCATNSNLAAMVADPADLVRGEPGSPTSDQRPTPRRSAPIARQAHRRRRHQGNAEAPK
jgi:pilus assembly protein CpaD